ncbi:MAG TPA: STAS/SEC14 domain-containing protein [Polyangiaceae bacterium]|jgi:hypothetical protein
MQGAPVLVYELLPEQQLLVSWQNTHEASDDEWDNYVQAVSSLRGPGAASLVLTDGGYPTRKQQARLFEQIKDNRRVAVVSSASTLRFVVSILSFINPNIKSYMPDELVDAITYLRVPEASHPIVLATVESLRRRLERPSIVAA